MAMLNNQRVEVTEERSQKTFKKIKEHLIREHDHAWSIWLNLKRLNSEVGKLRATGNNWLRQWGQEPPKDINKTWENSEVNMVLQTAWSALLYNCSVPFSGQGVPKLFVFVSIKVQ